jgi:hypothetical protein
MPIYLRGGSNVINAILLLRTRSRKFRGGLGKFSANCLAYFSFPLLFVIFRETPYAETPVVETAEMSLVQTSY